ncbi:MAG: cytochrome c3 family protein [Planctomycetota bacterium]
MTPRSVLLVLALALAAFALSCALDGTVQRDVPGTQGWSAALGPVVPHDRFPSDCSLCHAGGAWHELRADFTFDHAKETGVALEGAHAEARCLRCHNDRGPVGQFAARGCGGCHEDVHRARLGGDCAACHDELDWRARGARADHARTRFPLVGPHAAAACERCHPGAAVQNFEGAEPECAACHGEDLLRASAPNHFVEGWTSDCQRCHDGLAWRDATFTHRDGDFQCVNCHRDDYERARNPDHAGGGYPTSCLFCHFGNDSWSGAYFVHFWFPITSGVHSGNACTVCHSTGAGGIFNHASCLVCHEHGERRSARQHVGVKGYVYDSDQCWACHPDGAAPR